MKTGSKKNVHVPTVKVSSSAGGPLFVLLFVAVIGLAGFYGQNRIQEIHKELFNAEAHISYDFDFSEMAVIARSKITSQPRADLNRWKELPFMSQPQVYRITHKIGIGSHKGTIELKISDNKSDAEFLGSDMVINFFANSDDIGFEMPPFNYDTQTFRLAIGDASGTFYSNGALRFKAKSVEMKMVNYIIKFSDVNVDVPADKNAITILASKIFLDELNLDSSKLVFMGTDPFEIKLDSSFKSGPIALHWNIQKTKILDQEVKVSSGTFRFPASLLNSYVDPKVDRLMMTQEKEAQNGGNEKVRFLFKAAKEVRRAEAKAAVLKQLSAGNFEREGEFFVLQINHDEAMKLAEERTQLSAKRQEYINGWLALSQDKMLEEAFFALIFGDQNRAEAVRDLVALKEKELKDQALLPALKVRLAMREAQFSEDEYSYSLLDFATRDALQISQKLGDNKFGILLPLEIARAKKDRTLEAKLTVQYVSKEENPQLKNLFLFLSQLHSNQGSALKTLEQAYNQDAKSVYIENYLRHRIHVHRHANDLVKMEADLKQLFAATKPIPEDLANFATLLKEKNDLPSALASVEKCLNIDPANKNCNDLKETVMTGMAFEKQKENQDEAIDYLVNILIDRPSSIPVNKGLGFLYRMKGDLDRSINHYSIACALEDSLSCTEAGDFLLRKGDSERALLLFDVSCDLKSGNGCMRAGLQAEKAGQLERSGNYFDRSCNQFNESSGCYHLARNLQMKRASNKEIAPYLNKACKLYPSACKLASLYQKSNKQPPIPIEPK